MKRPTLIVLVVIPAAVLVVAIVMWGMNWYRAREAAEHAQAQQMVEEDQNRQCRQRLIQIGEGLAAYAWAHGGTYPDSLAKINVSPVCPKSNEQYVFVGAGFNPKSPDPQKYVIVYEASASHFGQRWFLMGDGYVQILTPQVSDPMIAALKAGKNPPQ